MPPPRDGQDLLHDIALALQDDGIAGPVTIGKRTMREWVEVPAGADSDATFTAWMAFAREALLYVRSIPA